MAGREMPQLPDRAKIGSSDILTVEYPPCLSPGTGTDRRSINDYFPPGVKWLLIVNTAVFILYTLGGYTLQRPMVVLFGLSANAAIKSFLVWQVFTYMFLHQGVWHLLFNMLTLWMFGTQIERDMGTRRFLKYYFFCGIAAAVCVLIVNMLIGDWTTPTIGASGAIFGRAGRIRRALPEPDRADEFPFSDQSQIHGDDLCRNRTAGNVRTQHRRQHGRASRRYGFRVSSI